MSDSTVFRGVIHGKSIELDQEPGLPEGQPVHVTVQPVTHQTTKGEALKRAFGGWSDDADELGEFLEWNRIQRKHGRPEMKPHSGPCERLR